MRCDGRQHRDVPVRREVRRAAVRAARVVHAQADLRAERQRDAHAPVALPRQARTRSTIPRAQWELSETALHYIGGLLRHARGYTAITNPLVNSYKRLVPGYEAPANVAWSMRNRSPMLRIPARRQVGTRVEQRAPDPAANPYLALAVMLAAGLDGIETRADYREPVNENICEMTHRERRRLRIDDLPHDLNEACDELEKDDVIRDALGAHVTRTSSRPSARSGATT